MTYQLQLKPFERKDGLKYKVIKITDITLHTAEKHATTSPGKEVRRILDSDTAGRIYAPLQKQHSPEKGAPLLDLLKADVEFVKLIQEEERKGYKILIQLPSEGIPLLAGKDTQEFIKSKNGKRAIRGLAKGKTVT